ncbi:MAG: hypothetical protein ACREV3_02240 [Gammaproteobacteria bacterium]
MGAGWGLGFGAGALTGGGTCRGEADEMEFVAVEQFPLDRVAGVKADGGGQGDGDVDVKFGAVALRADGLDFQGILGFESGAGILGHGGLRA